MLSARLNTSTGIVVARSTHCRFRDVMTTWPLPSGTYGRTPSTSSALSMISSHRRSVRRSAWSTSRAFSRFDSDDGTPR